MSSSRQPTRISSDLWFGPATLVGANLIDLYLATCVFMDRDPLAGALAFFIFGAATGVPLQLAFSRSPLAVLLERASAPPRGPSRDGRAVIAGSLGAVSTAAWLYCLTAGEPAVVFPLANLTILIFAIAEGVRGRLSPRRVAAPVVVLLVGLWTMRMPGASALFAITPAVAIALLIRNISGAASEAVERDGAAGSISRFTAVRFVSLAGTGIPLAIVAALATGRGAACARLIADHWTVALPFHAVTMFLTFIGGFCRTRAKGGNSLTLCAAAYATPLVLAPTMAVVINAVAGGVFPTVKATGGLLGSAVLVVSGAIWLTLALGRHTATVPSRTLDT